MAIALPGNTHAGYSLVFLLRLLLFRRISSPRHCGDNRREGSGSEERLVHCFAGASGGPSSSTSLASTRKNSPPVYLFLNGTYVDRRSRTWTRLHAARPCRISSMMCLRPRLQSRQFRWYAIGLSSISCGSLREIKLSHFRVHADLFDLSLLTVTLNLPTSKTDPTGSFFFCRGEV